MANTNLLKSKIALTGSTQKKLAKILNLSLGSLNQKIANKIIFKPSEIAKIQEVLNLTNDEVVEIFIN